MENKRKALGKGLEQFKRSFVTKKDNLVYIDVMDDNAVLEV